MSNALLIDRYELTMLGAYLREGIINRRSVFDLGIRKLPSHRNFLVFCGLDRILDYLEHLRFEPREIAYLMSCDGLRSVMTREMGEYLRNFRFRGTVYSMPEGTLAFGNEPMIRVEGGLGECQIIETFLLGVVNSEVRTASRAARVFLAAQGRPVYDFGARRADPATAPRNARAAYIAGYAGTSCDQAGLDYGIPVVGTMAHSYVLAHPEEGEVGAFRHFAESFPEGTTMLVDTYDTLRGVERAGAIGDAVKAVRLDSGDLLPLSWEARAILNRMGRQDVKIMASNALDEYSIRDLVSANAAIEAFGVGEVHTLSSDEVKVGAVYKLVSIEDSHGNMVPVGKYSPGKPSYGGRKQVLRVCEQGQMVADSVVLADNFISLVNEDATPLLKCAMRDGVIVGPGVWTQDSRQTFLKELASLPEYMKSLSTLAPNQVHPVTLSEEVLALRASPTNI